MPTYPSSLYKGVARSANGTTNTDFGLAQANLTTLISAYTTAVTSITATERSIAVALSGISYNNLQSKMEKMAYEFNKLIADVTLVNAGTAGGATTALGRYPSSWNRYTNTAGGL